MLWGKKKRPPWLSQNYHSHRRKRTSPKQFRWSSALLSTWESRQTDQLLSWLDLNNITRVYPNHTCQKDILLLLIFKKFSYQTKSQFTFKLFSELSETGTHLHFTIEAISRMFVHENSSRPNKWFTCLFRNFVTWISFNCIILFADEQNASMK